MDEGTKKGRGGGKRKFVIVKESRVDEVRRRQEELRGN